MGEELTVGIDLGLTIKVDDFTFIKPTAYIHGVQVGPEAERQVAEAIETIGFAWVKVDEKLEELVLEELSKNPENQAAGVIDKIKKDLATLKANLSTTVEEVKRQKGILDNGQEKRRSTKRDDVAGRPDGVQEAS